VLKDKIAWKVTAQFSLSNPEILASSVTADAETTSGRSLFLADAASLERHRSSIRAYKTRAAHAVRNVKELSHV
jgi:hypothetical protein